jgi:hypothetical protein
MLSAGGRVPDAAGRSTRRRAPLTYPQALEIARQLVAQEASDRGNAMSEDELELAAAKRASKVFRHLI